MPLIVTDTGTYNWGYTAYAVGKYPKTVEENIVSALAEGFRDETISECSDKIVAAANQYGYVKVKGVFAMSTVTNTYLYEPDIGPGDIHQIAPYVIRTNGPYFLQEGPSYDSGTVQVYEMEIVIFGRTEVGVDPYYVKNQEYSYKVRIIYATNNAQPEDPPEPEIPPQETAPATIQVARVSPGAYQAKPSDMAILEKYRNPVGFIRAKYNTTQVAVIVDNRLGGFNIYEEVGGVPYGTVYVYNSNRALHAVIPAADIGQYAL